MDAGTIRSIKVEELFGQYSYSVPEEGSLSNPAILYGDNGVGKSTLLTLVFHLLSGAGDRGHRTAIWNTQFSSLTVALDSGFVLAAKRPDGPESKRVVFTVELNGQLEAEWMFNKERSETDYIVDEDVSDILIEQLLNERKLSPSILQQFQIRKKSETDGVKRGEKAYLKALQECSPTIFMVSAERRLDSDVLRDHTDDVEYREAMYARKGRNIRDFVKRSRQIALEQALQNASIWIRNKALHSTALGSMNVHSVYEQVLGQLAVDYSSNTEQLSESDVEALLKSLDDIERDSESFSKYDLTGAIDMRRFRAALMDGPGQGRYISAKLIDPYVRGVLGRLEAIKPTYEILDKFVKKLNIFLTRKEMRYSISRGFSVENELGDELEPSQLSSGEQQLLLMFCYALTAQDQPSVFIVDEPEISLNIKWQRQLLNALSDVTRGSRTQFIFASHSLELIAQHRSSVVEIG